MNICIYSKYIFCKEIWIQIQQKCDKPAMVKEGFESDHPIMNHNYSTATLFAVASGPIQIKTPLSWLLSFSINHFLNALFTQKWPSSLECQQHWMESMLFPEARASLKCLNFFLTFNQPLNIRWTSPAAGYKPLVYLSFINHILLLLPFTGPMYLFPTSPHAHHCRKTPQKQRQRMCTDLFRYILQPWVWTVM